MGGRTDIRIPCLNHHRMRSVCECSSGRRRSKGYLHPLYKTSVPDRHMLKTFPSVFAHFTEMRTSLRTSASGPDKGERALSVGVSVNQARTHTCVTVDRLCCLRCTCINISWHAINPPEKRVNHVHPKGAMCADRKAGNKSSLSIGIHFPIDNGCGRARLTGDDASAERGGGLVLQHVHEFLNYS